MAGTAAVNGRLWGSRARDWAEIQEGGVLPAYVAALDRAGVGPGTAYLDVGCGAGRAALVAAGRGAQVSGIDAASALLAIARERVPAGDFREGELQELPFAHGRFDVVTGFNSFQFAADPVAALREARRVTKPGGRVVVMTWGEPEGMEMASVVAALRPVLPPPPPGAPGPFALSDETKLRAFASDAGLGNAEVFDVACPYVYPDLQTGVRGLNSAGVAVRAMEHSGEAAVSEAHARALAPFRQADGSYRLTASYRCLMARV
jgi:SAM-dependent methyltransferase